MCSQVWLGGSRWTWPPGGVPDTRGGSTGCCCRAKPWRRVLTLMWKAVVNPPRHPWSILMKGKSRGQDVSNTNVRFQRGQNRRMWLSYATHSQCLCSKKNVVFRFLPALIKRLLSNLNAPLEQLCCCVLLQEAIFESKQNPHGLPDFSSYPSLVSPGSESSRA